MKQIPNMISTKDLSYLEDMFNWHFTISKKAYTYSTMVVDEDISTYLETIAKEHEKICKKIIKIME